MALSLIALVLIASFLSHLPIQPTFVLGMQTTFGSLEPSSVKVTWGVSQSLIAFILLLAGGNGVDALNAIQSAAIISAFPFSL